MRRTLSLLAVLTAAATAACSSSEPYCGDGELNAPEELCDDGNNDDSDYCLSTCRPHAVPTLTIKWEFNKGVTSEFTGDSCTDLGVRRVEVEITGDGNTYTAEESCSLRQVVFSDVPPANYAVTVRPIDVDDNLMTTVPVERAALFAGGVYEEIVVNVAPEEWNFAPSGTFFFRVSWDGDDCDQASPPVVSHRLGLTVNGRIVVVATQDGTRLDGSAAASCVPLSESYPQAALKVPFGFAQFEIMGLDASGTTRYRQTFDTFVGAGQSNPEFTFDVSPAF